MARTQKTDVLPTFHITNDATMDEFLAVLGMERPARGGLPMIAAMRKAAEQGRAFTIDGYSPSDGVVNSVNYTIGYKSPGGVDTMVLSLEEVRNLNGVKEGTRGRTSVQAFTNAVAAKIGTDPDFVKAVSIVGDAPGARDLCIPLERKGKATADNSAEGTDAEQDNGDEDNSPE